MPPNDPRSTIKKLIDERYSDAIAVYWAGSVSKDEGTSASDLDLVIVYDVVPTAYREAFIYDGWPIDAFIHDKDTLRYFFEESRDGSGISGLLSMIVNGQEIKPASPFSDNLKKLAKHYLKEGPKAWDKEQIDKERFLITDVLEDILTPKSRAEQIASAAWLYEALAQFYFRSKNTWCASGKSIIRYLKQDNLTFSEEFSGAFEEVFQSGNTMKLDSLVKKILEPYGGFLWDSYKSDAPKEARISKSIALGETVDSYQFYLEESANAEVEAVLFEGIKSYNESKIGEYTRRPYIIYVKCKEDSKIIGGCDGTITDLFCYVHRLWVDPDNRMNGIGSKLLIELEYYAKKKGCQTISVDTAEFQAKPFYEKLGYSIVSTVDGVIFPGYKQYFMSKVL